MSVTFDITRTPLTSVELQQNRRKLASLTFAVQSAALFAGVLAWHFGLPTVLAVVGVSVVFCAAKVVEWNESTPYDDISEEACADLFEASQATPEGQTYRLAVLEQGRKFVHGEFMALQEWAESASARAACKKLYDIPSTTIRVASSVGQSA